MEPITNLNDFCIEKYYRDYLVDQGRGCRTVRYSAWRRTRPNVRGYGMTKQEAIHDLTHNVQPL